MPDTVTVRGRITGPTEVELDEPIAAVGAQVEVTVVASEVPAPGRVLAEIVKARGTSGRSKADIDTQLRRERDAWDR